jgi:hypothetical protein
MEWMLKHRTKDSGVFKDHDTAPKQHWTTLPNYATDDGFDTCKVPPVICPLIGMYAATKH